MPRVENLGVSVDAFCDKTGNGSSTFDICRRCNKKLEADPHVFDSKLSPYNGDPDGEDGRGGEVEHPAFELEAYHCAICKRLLVEEDN